MTYCYINTYGNEVCENSDWNDWGRWVLAGVLIGAFVLFVGGFIAFACITSRKRGKAGVKPYYGTAWAGPPAYSPNDPHPEAKELAESPAPSYSDAIGASSNAHAGEHVQDGMNTTSNAYGDHQLTPPPRVADPDETRDHGMV